MSLAEPAPAPRKPKFQPPQITDALRGPAPCDGCRSASRCAIERLACSAFAVYIDGKAEARWAIAPRLDASAARYRAIFRSPAGGQGDRRPVPKAGSARS